MFLMMAEVLHLGGMASNKNFKESPVWQFLGKHQSHVQWAGCSLHDLIQPSFSFLVGTSLAFSLLNRRQKGQSLPFMLLHALWRSLLLIWLGIFLRSGRQETNFTFEDTLTQIGLGYFFLFLISLASPRWWWAAFVAIVVGYFIAFASYPVPGPDFDFKAAGAPVSGPSHYEGFAGHWNKNSNLAWAFDTWFLNLFPRSRPFRFNGGGYATLSFIPTLGTMILGLIAGGWLRREESPWMKIIWLVLAGLVFLALGWAADFFGICPNVKRIWTSSWVLFSGGWCMILLAFFYLTLDAIGWESWAFPLRVIGMNSIAAYMIAHLWVGFIGDAYRTHLGQGIFRKLGPEYEPVVGGTVILLTMWLILLWMYRRKIFLRI